MAETNKAGRLIAIALASWTLASLAASATAFAQAGSTGGMIGNTDKSVSGERVLPLRANPRQVRRAAPTPVKSGEGQRETDSTCGRIVGTWTCFNNLDVVFKADGAGATTNGDTTTWVCDGGMYTLTWKTFGNTDRVTLASDG
jgi:hypothetical protein